MFNDLQETLQSILFLMSRNVETHGCQWYGTGPSRINLFSAERRIVNQGLGHLFTTSSSSHFFYKIDFKQYLFLL